MGEAPPYTASEIEALISGATLVGVKEWERERRNGWITFLLEKDGRPIELEVCADSDWAGANDFTEASSITSGISVCVRGIELEGE